MEFVFEYGLFVAKTVTIVIAVVAVIAVIGGLSQRGRRMEHGHIEVRSLNDRIEDMSRSLKQNVLNRAMLKQEMKHEKKEKKAREKAEKKQSKVSDGQRKSRVYVIDFHGDLQASAVKSLRHEVTAVLSVAEEQDEIVVRLESPGGQVHGYGLAASQLTRIVDKNIPLTVAVDKVAASGGYMMACIAGKIIAAPFAVLGSIGVVAQLPNFHRFLKNKDVDFEVLTAGEHKRTLTIFGENTEQGRAKFMEELEDVHALFKEFVGEHRPVVDLPAVATGEAWFGRRALDHKLCDELRTSDEYLVEKCAECDVYEVKYVVDKPKMERLFDRFSSMLRNWRGGAIADHPHHPHMF